MPGNANTPQTFPPALVPKNQVQQMVSALASAKCFHSKPIKKKREKDEKKDYESEMRSKTSYETCYETQSEEEDLPLLRRRKKGWKSKHKNVIDPVFLGELEHLIQDIASCHLDLKFANELLTERSSDCVP